MEREIRHTVVNMQLNRIYFVCPFVQYWSSEEGGINTWLVRIRYFIKLYFTHFFLLEAQGSVHDVSLLSQQSFEVCYMVIVIGRRIVQWASKQTRDLNPGLYNARLTMTSHWLYNVSVFTLNSTVNFLPCMYNVFTKTIGCAPRLDDFQRGFGRHICGE